MKRLTSITYIGKEYPIILVRKHMKRITMRPDHNGILVHAPIGVSISFIKAAINRHMPKFIASLNSDAPLSTNHIYFLGTKAYNDDAYLKTIFKASLDDYMATAFEVELRKKALLFFTKRVRHYEKVMGIARPYEVKVRKMKARLGSNEKHTHTLTFALKLIHYALPIIDAVVVHELAHDFAFDHSRNFYEVVEKYCPTYRDEHAKIKRGEYR